MFLRVVGTLGLTLSVLATIILPVPTLPPLPSGGFKVGTITDCWTFVTPSLAKGSSVANALWWGWRRRRLLVDRQRQLVPVDLNSVSKKNWQEQKLWVKVWYPADVADPRYLSSPHAPYLVLKDRGVWVFLSPHHCPCSS